MSQLASSLSTSSAKKTKRSKPQTAHLRAFLEGDTDDLFRALSLLRRKAFHITHLVWHQSQDSPIATLELTLEKAQPDNPHCPKVLLSRLVGIKEIFHDA